MSTLSKTVDAALLGWAREHRMMSEGPIAEGLRVEARDRLLAALAELDVDEHLVSDTHVATFAEAGWGLQHPISCRPDLLACRADRWLRSFVEEASVPAPGRYRVLISDRGGLAFAPLEGSGA
jgi:hypothetical protein